MNFGIHYRPEMNGYDIVIYPGRWLIQIDQKDLNKYQKSAVIISSLAVAILYSAYLAHSNPSTWWTTYATIGVVNLYLLPKVLHYGNAALIKTALIANLAAMTTFSLGMLGTITLSDISDLASSICSFQMESALISAFWLTFHFAYTIPFFNEGLLKSYQILNQPEVWEQKFLNLKKQFHRLPEMGLGLLQTNLWQNFILNFALLSPEKILDFGLYSFFSCPDYIWSMAAAVSDKLTLVQFKNLMNEMKSASDQIDAENLVNLNAHRQLEIPYEEVHLSENLQVNFCNRLKIMLRGLNKKDLSEAVLLLLEDGSKLIPRVISNERFLDLFKNDALGAAENIIQQFINSLQPWKEFSRRYADLKTQILAFDHELKGRLEQEDVPDEQKLNVTKYLDQLHPQVKKELVRQNHLINREYDFLQTEIGKIYKWTRIWKYLAPIWGRVELLPFENGPFLSNALQNQDLFLEIDQTYHSLSSPLNLNQIREDINQLIIPLEENVEAENLSAYLFLAVEKSFKVKEFDQLIDCLLVKFGCSKVEMDEMGFEEALAKIGIKTDEDLYTHDILKHDEIITKENILANFQKYIEDSPKPILNQIVPIANAKQNSYAHLISEKVVRYMYYAIEYGRFGVPFLIHLPAGAAGFSLGLVHYTLKRFQINSTLNPIDYIMHNLQSPRVNPIHPRSREAADAFVNAHFFLKMRIINNLLIPVLVLSYNKAGTFLFGLSAAKRVVSYI